MQFTSPLPVHLHAPEGGPLPESSSLPESSLLPGIVPRPESDSLSESRGEMTYVESADYLQTSLRFQIAQTTCILADISVPGGALTESVKHR